MSETRALELCGGLGNSWSDGLFLAIHGGEWEPEVRFSRTFVLKPAGEVVEVVDVLPESVEFCWYSEGSGTGYCPTRGGRILLYGKGAWTEETVCGYDDEFYLVGGLAGNNPDEDQVFLRGSNSLFVRKGGTWTEHRYSEAALSALGMHASAPSELYLATARGPALFDGSEFHAMEGPAPLRSVLVLGEDTLLAVGHEDLHLWQDDQGWTPLECPSSKLAVSCVQFAGDVYVGALDGPLRIRGTEVTRSSDFKCTTLVSMGDRLVGAGSSDGAWVLKDGTWLRLTLPEFEAGAKVP